MHYCDLMSILYVSSTFSSKLFPMRREPSVRNDSELQIRLRNMAKFYAQMSMW